MERYLSKSDWLLTNTESPLPPLLFLSLSMCFHETNIQLVSTSDQI